MLNPVKQICIFIHSKAFKIYFEIASRFKKYIRYKIQRLVGEPYSVVVCNGCTNGISAEGIDVILSALSNKVESWVFIFRVSILIGMAQYRNSTLFCLNKGFEGRPCKEGKGSKGDNEYCGE